LGYLARLVQPTEIDQFVGSIALNEHSSLRDFEDHMFNEFIWNRNRNLNQVWFDADFGMFRQNASYDKTVSGNRFNITAGFDWQNSNRTVLGLMAHVSHMAADNSDDIDLSYKPGETIAGHNNVDVADTNVGIGGYLMHVLGTKARVYGNAMLDLHLLDVSREQNYVDDITGFGTDVSLISEWGLMHDMLNQYVVGNLYARLGYNFGFDVKEKSAGDDYMHLKSDGYFILTPGYSLIAQKRIYPSQWFQIRPYASIGVEYDVLGTPGVAKYKFAPAEKYSEYDIEIDPLWANIGAGVELLSANGLQFGFDYRYQYNDNVQLHNLKISGSFRF
ncbi:MAG: autotransporter outer membrane beta-barrel domain-containing protein, partial [Alphaproteobacteria bacterium]|nr:autotransporter outer membrane beta-barrel domain-containing protein [Alphaproteobacteria bacterium]